MCRRGGTLKSGCLEKRVRYSGCTLLQRIDGSSAASAASAASQRWSGRCGRQERYFVETGSAIAVELRKTAESIWCEV